MNTQPILKRRENDDGNYLFVHSIFDTIQGEGPFTGRRAIFIRLAGCNLQCPKCDTEYTQGAEHIAVDAIVQKVKDLAAMQTPIVVITGGEPFRQNLETLVRELVVQWFTVQIETNGTLAPPSAKFADLCALDPADDGHCFIVCSPKTGKVNIELHPLICAYKYVMSWDSVGADGLPMRALDHTASPMLARPHAGFGGPVYLQPCDDHDEGANERNIRACVKSVMQHGYTLQLQIHKLIGVE